MRLQKRRSESSGASFAGSTFSGNTSHSRTRSIVLCGLSIALLSVGAAIQVPLGPIPFTLQTLMFILILLVLTPAEALVAVGGYLVLGAVGLPVFSGFRGGFGVLLGPTGGFLMGFFAAALFSGLLRVLFGGKAQSFKAAVALDVACILVVTFTYYAAGTWWFSFSTGATVSAALAACVIPFLVPDALKIAAAFVCAQPIRVALGRAINRMRPLPSEEVSKKHS
ncbi:MAG: biotin transporter BioY [Coriobacteriales bacterium]|jgi:biotin transport system substrate-specific component|nr:biotin transporter BioY [Coriobacteriales bacterium]